MPTFLGFPPSGKTSGPMGPMGIVTGFLSEDLEYFEFSKTDQRAKYAMIHRLLLDNVGNVLVPPQLSTEWKGVCRYPCTLQEYSQVLPQSSLSRNWLTLFALHKLSATGAVYLGDFPIEPLRVDSGGEGEDVNDDDGEEEEGTVAQANDTASVRSRQSVNDGRDLLNTSFGGVSIKRLLSSLDERGTTVETKTTVSRGGGLPNKAINPTSVRDTTRLTTRATRSNSGKGRSSSAKLSMPRSRRAKDKETEGYQEPPSDSLCSSPARAALSTSLSEDVTKQLQAVKNYNDKVQAAYNNKIITGYQAQMGVEKGKIDVMEELQSEIMIACNRTDVWHIEQLITKGMGLRRISSYEALINSPKPRAMGQFGLDTLDEAWLEYNSHSRAYLEHMIQGAYSLVGIEEAALVWAMADMIPKIHATPQLLPWIDQERVVFSNSHLQVH